MKSFALLAFIASVAASVSTCVLPAFETCHAAERMNVIVLLVDDWGWMDAGCQGSDLYKTPNIDQFATDAVTFTNGYAACTVCSPTRASMMTGMYPGRTRVTDFITGNQPANAKLLRPDWTQRLEKRHTTLPEAMQAAGYRTAHIGKWHLMPRGKPDMNEYLPQHHGFDVNIAGNEWGAPGSYFFPYGKTGRQVGQLPPGGKEGDYLTDRLTDEAVKILSSFKDDPFFIYFPYYNVHTPLMGKPDLVKHYAAEIKDDAHHTNAKYAAMVHSVDDSVGRIRATLESLKIADKTMIILTGDNGGLDRNNNPTDNHPLRDGKGTAYEGGVRVPTFVYVPGITQPKSVCETPIVTCDFYPTILELTGATGTAGHNKNVDGVSIVPLLKQPQAQLDRTDIFWHYPHYHSCGATPYSAIRSGDWRLIEFFEDNHVELYNLKDDLSETTDLAASKPKLAIQLRSKLHAWRKFVDAQMPSANPEYDPNAKPKKRARKKNTK